MNDSSSLMELLSLEDGFRETSVLVLLAYPHFQICSHKFRNILLPRKKNYTFFQFIIRMGTGNITADLFSLPPSSFSKIPRYHPLPKLLSLLTSPLWGCLESMWFSSSSQPHSLLLQLHYLFLLKLRWYWPKIRTMNSSISNNLEHN